MKSLKIVLVGLMALCIQKASAQTNSNQDTMRRHYTRLASSKDEADKAQLRAELYQLLKSEKEADWLLAAQFFYQLNRNTNDSIRKAILIRFPNGVTVRNAAVDTIYNEKDPVKKEELYKAWVKKFPPEKYGKDRIQYDYVRSAVASAYAEADNVNKAVQYANMTETEAWKGEGWAGPATRLMKSGHEKEALELFKKARNNAYKFMTTNRNDYGAGFAAMGFPGYSNFIAEILYKQKKYAEALKYIKEAHDSAKTVRAYINSNYAKILASLRKDKEAFEIINEAVVAGQGNAEMKEQLKTRYVKVKGSDAGYDEYIAQLDKQLEARVREDLTKQMIKIPASNFTLKDVDGKTVSLTDYKGKIVVLDFWATWCGPCKRSFPAMKLAQDKFQDDPNVKFLFIHTMEHEAASKATANAKKYITDNNFPFEVLMDVVNPETGMNDVAKNYKVDAIPTKFVVDKNGNIRFRLLGFSSTDEAAVHEVATMIDMADKGN